MEKRVPVPFEMMPKEKLIKIKTIKELLKELEKDGYLYNQECDAVYKMIKED